MRVCGIPVREDGLPLIDEMRVFRYAYLVQSIYPRAYGRPPAVMHALHDHLPLHAIRHDAQHLHVYVLRFAPLADLDRVTWLT